MMTMIPKNDALIKKFFKRSLILCASPTKGLSTVKKMVCIKSASRSAARSSRLPDFSVYSFIPYPPNRNCVFPVYSTWFAKTIQLSLKYKGYYIPSVSFLSTHRTVSASGRLEQKAPTLPKQPFSGHRMSFETTNRFFKPFPVSIANVIPLRRLRGSHKQYYT